MPTMQEISAAMTGFPKEVPWSAYPMKKGDDMSAMGGASYNFNSGKTQLVKGTYRRTGVKLAISFSTSAWATKSARTSEELRRHEQGHYDITALVARDMLMKTLDLSFDEMVIQVSNQSGNNAQSWLRYADGLFEKDIKKFQTEARDLLNKLQTRPDGSDGIYDTDTNHSQNTDEQNKWNARFARAKTNNEDFGFMLKIAGVV